MELVDLIQLITQPEYIYRSEIYLIRMHEKLAILRILPSMNNWNGEIDFEYFTSTPEFFMTICIAVVGGAFS